MDIPDYTREEFMTGTEPYEYVSRITNSFEREQTITQLEDLCSKVAPKVKFRNMLKEYMKNSDGDLVLRYTEFEGQPFELALGAKYIADEHGVRKLSNGEVLTVCAHPIMPVARLKNVDSGEYGIEVMFRHRGMTWEKMVFTCEELASANKITRLAAYGIAVNTENAKRLSTYLTDVCELNHDLLPERLSIDRLGWVGQHAFVPYAEDYVFEGEGKYKQMFDAIHEQGDSAEWYDSYRRIRALDCKIPRLAVAASLASVLVQPCGALPFVVHMWGKTGCGKTAALMIATSVWADPNQSKYIHSFNATSVGLEMIASFSYNMPVMLDELQTISSRGSFEDMMYQLTEGQGRARGAKDGGMKSTGAWLNSIITTGEQPITSANSGGGTINRVIEISCPDGGMIPDFRKEMDIVKQNYGFLGEEFVYYLINGGMKMVKAYQEAYSDEIARIKPDVTEKQKIAASLMLAADAIATKHIVGDDNYLEAADITQYLSGSADADKNARAYEWLEGWIAENACHFIDDATPLEEVHCSIYGKVRGDDIAIIRSVFDEAVEDAGFNARAFAKWLKEKGYTKCSLDVPYRTTLRVKIIHNEWCVYLKGSAFDPNADIGEPYTEIVGEVPSWESS